MNNPISVPDIDKILDIPQDKLAAVIRPSGYFNQKAKKLKNICIFLKENPISKLEKMETRALRELLLSVNGIGPETADSIMLFALGKPSFVIDAYTKRIFSRLGVVKKNASYDELQRFFHKNLERDARMFNEYHALIVEHAKRYCRKMPLCKECILKDSCKNYHKAIAVV